MDKEKINTGVHDTSRGAELPGEEVGVARERGLSLWLAGEASDEQSWHGEDRWGQSSLGRGNSCGSLGTQEAGMGRALGPEKPTLTLPLIWQFWKLMPWVWAMTWPDVFYKDASGMCGEQTGRGQRRSRRGQNRRRWWLVQSLRNRGGR